MARNKGAQPRGKHSAVSRPKVEAEGAQARRKVFDSLASAGGMVVVVVLLVAGGY